MKCDLKTRIYLCVVGEGSDSFQGYRTPLPPSRAVENVALCPVPGSLTAGLGLCRGHSMQLLHKDVWLMVR